MQKAISHRMSGRGSLKGRGLESTQLAALLHLSDLVLSNRDMLSGTGGINTDATVLQFFTKSEDGALTIGQDSSDGEASFAKLSQCVEQSLAHGRDALAGDVCDTSKTQRVGHSEDECQLVYEEQVNV